MIARGKATVGCCVGIDKPRVTLLHCDTTGGEFVMPTIRVDEEVFRALQSQAQPLVDTPNSVLRRLLGLDPQAQRAPIDQQPSHAGRDTGGFRPVDDLSVKFGQLPPRKLRLPDGEIKGLTYWNSLLLQAARHLAKMGKLRPESCPVQLPRARNRYLIHTDTRHPSGMPFRHPLAVANGIWIEAHANGPDLHRQTIALLRQFREDPSRYEVEVA